MIGLCPNHHKMLHMIEHKDFLQEVIERLVTMEGVQSKLFFIQKTDNKTYPTEPPQNQIMEIPISIKT